MKTSDFDFYLPQHLIAQEPPKERGASRLMTINRVTGGREHNMVQRLPKILCEKHFLSPSGEPPIMVFNDTKVRKARLFAADEQTGAKTEFLLLEYVNENEWKALAHRLSRRKIGSRYVFADIHGNIAAKAEIIRTDEEFCFIQFDTPIDDKFLDKYGHVPLPPYIKREDTPDDEDRYQTIYAKDTGSAAAPTAGLHFTDEILSELEINGIEKLFITLHVGLGTFQPVRSENVQDHVMHEEQYIINDENACILEKAIANKRKIIAVGTTSLRSLESAISENGFKRGWQSTSIFIYPGYQFKAVDALFTNFHTPQSTLIMLVSAFANRELMLDCYNEAVKEEYKFFSYGDAMLIH
ncbi:MAG: tRNA preQ1(34) S-adenosylmethionine ribosyltransferase-isomerase QueA [Treponema sp.]|nr:tRNA preQ1(34) S-adenosylmethionine ribosyltransferase-isomerase QueA [Treponema sp.]